METRFSATPFAAAPVHIACTAIHLEVCLQARHSPYLSGAERHCCLHQAREYAKRLRAALNAPQERKPA